MTDSSQHGTAQAGSRLIRAAARRRRLWSGLGSSAVLAGALGYVGLVDPHHRGSFFPVCPFRVLTGWNCPLCGGLRMTHDVLHGELSAAVVDNVFLLVGLPILAGWILLCRRRENALLSTPVAVMMIIAMLAWTVVRNLPGFPLVPTLVTVSSGQ